jgi:hypothetical protein
VRAHGTERRQRLRLRRRLARPLHAGLIEQAGKRASGQAGKRASGQAGKRASGQASCMMSDTLRPHAAGTVLQPKSEGTQTTISRGHVNGRTVWRVGADPHEHPPQIPTGVGALVSHALKAAMWLVRRPFVIPFWAWSVLVGGTFAASGLSLALGWWLPGAVLLVAALVCAAVVVQWRLLVRGGDPVVVLSPFASATASAREAALTQTQSLRRFLTTDENIMDAGGVTCAPSQYRSPPATHGGFCASSRLSWSCAATLRPRAAPGTSARRLPSGPTDRTSPCNGMSSPAIQTRQSLGGCAAGSASASRRRSRARTPTWSCVPS